MTGSFFDGAKGGKYDRQVQEENARMNFFRSSSGTRGDFLPSNPQLKVQPKPAPAPARQQRRQETQAEKTTRINQAVRDFFTPKGNIGGGYVPSILAGTCLSRAGPS